MTHDGVYKYYYDCENRLTDVNDQNDDPVASYKYDYLGRRVSKIVHGDPNVVTKYCYDGDQVILEYSGGGGVMRIMYYGAGIDEPVIIGVTGVGSFYVHYDGLGSVAALSDGAGNIRERYTYDVFGRPKIYDANGDETSQSLCGNPYMLTGHIRKSLAGPLEIDRLVNTTIKRILKQVLFHGSKEHYSRVLS